MVALVVLGAARPADALEARYAPADLVATRASSWPPVSLVLGPAGEATLAWAGLDGIFTASRPAAGGPWSAPITVSDHGREPLVARNDAGVQAIAWMHDDRLAVAIAAPGGAFGPAEEVPLPDPVPSPPERSGSGHYAQLSGVAVGADGTVVVGYADIDQRTDPETARAVIAQRSAAGRWEPAQVFASGSRNGPEVAADATGTIIVAWIDAEPGKPDVVRVAERRGPGGFGSPRAISDPADDASSGTPAHLAINRRGEAIVLWNAVPGTPIGSAVHVALRSSDGEWSPPTRLDAGLAFRPTAALNDRGDMIVAWSETDGVGASFRPAGGVFGPPEKTVADDGAIEEMPVAIDALGNALSVRRDDSGGEQIAALLRPRAGPFGAETVLSTDGKVASAPALATDPFGNGLVAWGEWTGGPEGSELKVAAYSATPPRVSRVRLVPGAVALRVSEPARLRVTVRSRSARAVISGRATRRGEIRLPTGGDAASVTRGSGRLWLIVRARDAGPRKSVRRVRIR